MEPRILIEDPDKSYHAPQRVSENDVFDNMLIHGDNLLALKALEQEYTGKVKCVFIDPPYNTGSAFEHYEDGIEHSLWLSMMRDRLAILWKLLTKDGAIWICCDENEGHYLKVLCDEEFGRASFVSTIVWENFYGRSNAAAISPAHNYLFLYSPLGLDWKKVRNLLPRDEKSSSKYKNPDDDPRGPWRLGPIFANGERHAGLMYTVTTPSGRKVSPPRGSHWRMLEKEFSRMVSEGRISFGDSGDNIPAIKLFLNEVQGGLVPRSWWPHTEVGHSQEAKREIQAIFSGDIPFDTPKPERLVERAVLLSSSEGDIVLDSFLGSGTTAAVAHKMNRRWIGVELGEHCSSHCRPRLQKIVDGKDLGGITESANWKGGGGFRYYELGPSLIEQDKWGNPIISKEFDPPKLTQAMCKLEGFDYAPDPDTYWMQGHSSETDFIYVTSQAMSKEMLTKLSDEVGENRSLLVCCPSFRAKESDFDNLSLKKIPKAVLKKCEWGRDDYSLQIQELPPAPSPEEEQAEEKPKKPRRKFGKGNPNQGELF